MNETSALPGLRHYLPAAAPAAERTEHDLVVHGATSGGVTAAVAAARAGSSVLLLAFGDHVGGLTTGGLGETDVGRGECCGGLARDFYREVAAAYGAPDPHWRVESHVASEIYHRWLAEAGVTVLRRQHLAGVSMVDGRITALHTDDGATHVAPVYVDASYEGDLMAFAGVGHTYGRESAEVYGEDLAGVRHVGEHQFTRDVDPYVEPGNPSGGLLPGVVGEAYGTDGDGDRCVQAYNFRLHVTTAPDRFPYPRPEGYDPARYELLRRYIAAGVYELYGRTTPIRGDVYDMNNHGAVSSDHIGANHDWPTADHHRREEIFQDHVRYQAGLLHFLANDPGLPADVREKTREYGLAPAEFGRTSHWPPQLYIREARRMVSDYVITQADAAEREPVEDPVALASYVMDSHNARRVVVDGRVRNEGNVQHPLKTPLGIPYRAIRPRVGECRNLLVASAISASHVAFASVRMEPVFMMLGEAAGHAARIALEANVDVQAVDYETLRKELTRTGAVLSWPPSEADGEGGMKG